MFRFPWRLRVALLWLVATGAYVDPGIGALLWQLVMAAAVGLGFKFRGRAAAVRRWSRRFFRRAGATD